MAVLCCVPGCSAVQVAYLQGGQLWQAGKSVIRMCLLCDDVMQGASCGRAYSTAGHTLQRAVCQAQHNRPVSVMTSSYSVTRCRCLRRWCLTRLVTRAPATTTSYARCRTTSADTQVRAQSAAQQGRTTQLFACGWSYCCRHSSRPVAQPLQLPPGLPSFSVMPDCSACCAACLCCAVYDYEYTSPERGTFKKLVFLLW